MENMGKESDKTNKFRMENIVVPVTEEMKAAAEYSFHKNWEKFWDFFAERDQSYLSKPLDWMGNTALHVATRANDPNLLRDLLSLIEKEQERFEVLSKKNTHGNTVLHHAIHSKNVHVLDALMGYKDTEVRSPKEIEESVGEDERKLLQQQNTLGETPVYRAARFGMTPMLVHLRKHYLSKEDLLVHFPERVACEWRNSEKNPEGLGDRGEDRENLEDCCGESKDSGNSGSQKIKSIFEWVIACQYFDVAMWLISEVRDIEKQVHHVVAWRSLQLLSQMPSCFQSSMDRDVRSVEKFVYYFLPMPRCPEHRYKNFDDDIQSEECDKNSTSALSRSNDRSQKKDIESEECHKKPTSVLSRINSALWKFVTDVLSRINRAIWEFAADEWDQIDQIWEKKRQHSLAKSLVERLVAMQDLSILTFPNVTLETCPTIQPPNVHTRAIKATLHKTRSSVLTGDTFKSPLHLAASTGIKEIVECILRKYPQAIAYVEREQNILHVAVKHRQRGIYRVVKRQGALKWLGSQISNEDRTVLHQVARMDYYNGAKRLGVVLQLQDELRWFERVKRAIPPNLILHSNSDKLKASELFDIEHEEMLKEAREWIKGTAQSCSAVAVLVATVVFAAAYTVPGGVNDKGVPVLLDSPLFLFFTITDVAALACSLVSVMMFLSILTSPFEMENFLKCLPRKLELGFTLLFLSLTITMLTFSSTILLTLKLENNKWTTTLIHGVTFFPVAIFGMMQFPIYTAVKFRMKRVLKNFKKVLPERFTQKAGNEKYIKILY